MELYDVCRGQFHQHIYVWLFLANDCFKQSHFYKTFCVKFLLVTIIDIESLQIRLLKVCYVPATSARLPRLLFAITVLIKQTRQTVRAIKQSILLRCLWLTSITPCQTNVKRFGAEKVELCVQKIFKAFFGVQQIPTFAWIFFVICV